LEAKLKKKQALNQAEKDTLSLTEKINIELQE